MNEKKDIPWIHLVRVIACIMVICLHVSTASREYPWTYSDRIFHYLVYLLTKPCVPLFFMVTGFLILPYKNSDDIKTFYTKRIPRVWFPLLFWGVVYAVLPFLLGMAEWQATVREVLLSPIKQPDPIDGILWYLYILIGIYLFIPFLTEKIYNSRRLLFVYLIFWIVSSVVMVIKTHIPNIFGENHWVHTFDMFTYFSGYLGFILFGFASRKYHDALSINCLNQFKMGKLKYLIWILIASICSCFWGSLVKSFLTIGSVVMAVCVFMLIRDVNINDGWFYRSIKQISNLSFGIYLSHMLILKSITEYIFSISASWYNQLFCMFLTFIGAYLLSWIISKLPFKRYIIG